MEPWTVAVPFHELNGRGADPPSLHTSLVGSIADGIFVGTFGCSKIKN